MNILTFFINKFKTFAKFGTENINSASEIRYIKLTNYGCLIAILSLLIFNLTYTIADFNELWPLIINYDIAIPFVIFAFYLNKNKHFNASKLVLHSSVIIVTITGTVFLSGRQTGIHYYFLLYSILPIVFWPLKQFKYILFFFIVNLSAFFYVDFFSSTEVLLLKFPDNSLLFFNVFSTTFSFLTIGFIFLLFTNQANKSDISLQNKSDALNEINEDLISKNKEIFEQRNELERKNTTKEKKKSIIAHDLKSPCNAILGFSELLLSDEDIDNNKIKISISDTGIGIKNEIIKHIFEEKQFESTPRTVNKKGTGLGLKLCKEFALKNNAELEVKSEVNKGSVFSLIINNA